MGYGTHFQKLMGSQEPMLTEPLYTVTLLSWERKIFRPKLPSQQSINVRAMPQTLFTLIGWAIGFVVSFVTLFGFIHDNVDFVKSFFVNQSILMQEYDFIIVGGLEPVIRMSAQKNFLIELLMIVHNTKLCS